MRRHKKHLNNAIKDIESIREKMNKRGMSLLKIKDTKTVLSESEKTNFLKRLLESDVFTDFQIRLFRNIKVELIQNKNPYAVENYLLLRDITNCHESDNEEIAI